MNYDKIRGLIAAPFTPFHENGNLNLELVEKYATLLKRNNLAGVFIGGTTGEGMLMTVEERKALTEAWTKHQSDDFKVIVHVGATSYRDSQAIAKHADTTNAYAISTMGPLFLRPENIDDLISYCCEIAQSAENLPFYYYHIPSVSGVNFKMIDFLEKGKSHIPSLVGVKYTFSDLMDLNLCIRDSNGRWDILYGQDETLLAGLGTGAVGAVGSTYNYIAPLYRCIIECFEDGNLEQAKELQSIAAQFVRHLIYYGGGVIAGKPLMKLVGLDCGPLRAPANNIAEKLVTEFYGKIKSEALEKYFIS